MPGLALSDDSQRFLNRHDAEGFPHVDDEAGTLWDAFGVTQQSTYVFINDDGTWRISEYGSLRSDVEDLIAQ